MNGLAIFALCAVAIIIMMVQHWEHLKAKSMEKAMQQADCLFADLLRGGKRMEWIRHIPEEELVVAMISGEVFVVGPLGRTVVGDGCNDWIFWSYVPHTGHGGFNRTVRTSEFARVRLARIIGFKPDWFAESNRQAFARAKL